MRIEGDVFGFDLGLGRKFNIYIYFFLSFDLIILKILKLKR